jgi:hypothetical protein
VRINVNLFFFLGGGGVYPSVTFSKKGWWHPELAPIHWNLKKNNEITSESDLCIAISICIYFLFLLLPNRFQGYMIHGYTSLVAVFYFILVVSFVQRYIISMLLQSEMRLVNK